ncbi:MAG: hypothetical protein ACRD0H_29305 [Actinomycetes bacterium]
MRATTPEWVVVGAGLLAYVASFFPWHRTRVAVLGVERSVGDSNAWSAGFGAWFSVLLLVVAGGMVLTSAMGMRRRLTTSRPLTTLGLAALALITILLWWVTSSDTSDGQGDLDDIDVDGLFAVSSGAGPGLYLALAAAIVAVLASLLSLRRIPRARD